MHLSILIVQFTMVLHYYICRKYSVQCSFILEVQNSFLENVHQ